MYECPKLYEGVLDTSHTVEITFRGFARELEGYDLYVLTIANNVRQKASTRK